MNASNIDQILRKVVIVPVIALLAGAAALAWQINQANQTVALIQLCDRRIALTQDIEQLVVDQETGLRGYEITHDPRLLQRYLEARDRLPQAFERRRQLVVGSSRLVELDALENAYETWQQAFATPLIATIQAGGSTQDVTLNYQGKVLMDNIRQRIAALNSFTIELRDRSVQQWQRQVRVTILSLLFAAISLGLVIGLYIRRLLQQVSSAFRRSHDALRLRAEQTFRSEERLRTTLHSIADGVITCDMEGRVQSLNDTAQELTGWTEPEARDHPLSDIFKTIDPTNRQPLENPVTTVIRTNQRVRAEDSTLLIRRDGSEIFIEDSGSPIRDKQGALVGVVLVFRDVSLARKSQEALIANEKLAVAGRLAATIAHEIHNPLDSISNLLFLLDGVASDQEREHFVQLARGEIARVTHISRAMLSLYRESKAPVLIHIKEMLESILLLMEGRFIALGVQVQHEIPESLSIHGFPAELRQVFTNLLTNAAEASGKGGRIQISAQLVPGSAGEGPRQDPGVLIQIEDNGPGIPKNVISHLFQPFFTTKGERGTGLGLWISRGIIHRHGGTIELESSTDPDDHGTTLSIFLAIHPTIQSPAA